MMDQHHDGYFYIASPFNNPDAVVRQRRFEKALDFAVFLTLEYKMWCFTPIGHSYHMALLHDLPPNFEFWDAWNQCMIRSSIGVIVLEIDGWEQSRGIAAELEYAKGISKPIYYSSKLWKNYDHSL